MSISPWLSQHLSHIPNGRILDLACGGGRHSRFLLQQGFQVTALDKDISGLADIADLPGLTLLEHDLECGAPWPFAQAFDAILVFNYLHRPLFNTLAEAIRPGGLLIYQTFMAGNEAYGRPRSERFLLQPDELREWTQQQFEIIDFEQGYSEQPKPGMRQALCAKKL